MRRSHLTGIVAILCAIALTGCAAPAVKPPTSATPLPAPTAGRADRPFILTTSGNPVPTPEKIDHGIVRDDADIIFQLDVYQLTVPFGAVSSNARFWKHVDEDHVDIATHTLLLKNGLRYGIGPNDEWSYFKSLIDQYGSRAQKGSVAPMKKGFLELPMQTGVLEQTIFFFKEPHNLQGRTYENCDNFLSMTWEPTPRHPGDARIEACALVRGFHKQYVVTLLNDTREIELKSPEYIYDLRLRQDVPMDHFLILSPSDHAEFPDTMGHTFFVHSGPTGPTETVLLLVPRPFRVSK